MATYKAPIEDMRFVLHDVFDAESVWSSMPGTAEMSQDLADAVLEEAGKVAEGIMFPLNRSGDEEGCQFDNGVVTTPEGFKEAFNALAEGGWTAFSGNPEFGGQGMPKSLAVLFEEMMHSANCSLALYPLLSNGACLAIDAHATEELKQLYLPKIYAGEWSGTMCLTEPHSGTDLGILKTKAEPLADGSYEITGTKIFITGGEHDLTDNIVHLVLARLPEAPAGPKGISLFIVPKFLVNEDGSLGERNGAVCGSIEHKMGIKGSATCVMNFDNAKGWLVGEENNGLACMFTMMNYERVSIGLQGLGLGETSYQSAVEYALDRTQGRAATGAQNPDQAADPIIVHGDVRRMLMTMRALNQGGRALSAYLGLQLDIAKFSEDDEERAKAEDRVALLTPVAKAFFTDRGLETTILGQQVFGGHGYIREWGMEQMVRDIRIAQIYEGTNGIQALDLAGRKVARNQGASMAALVAEIRQWLQAEEGKLGGLADQLEASLELLETATANLLEQAAKDPNAINALAVEYLDIVGYVLYAWLWARMIATLDGREDEFANSKRITAAFYYERLLPKIHSLYAQFKAGSQNIMALAADQF